MYFLSICCYASRQLKFEYFRYISVRESGTPYHFLLKNVHYGKNISDIRASLKNRLIKEKTDRYGSFKETFRRRAAALRGEVDAADNVHSYFFSKGFLEMPLID